MSSDCDFKSKKFGQNEKFKHKRGAEKEELHPMKSKDRLKEQEEVWLTQKGEECSLSKDCASSSNHGRNHEENIRAENVKGLKASNAMLLSKIKQLNEENGELKWRIQNLEKILMQSEGKVPASPTTHAHNQSQTQTQSLATTKNEKKKRKKKDQINRIHKCPYDECDKAYG